MRVVCPLTLHQSIRFRSKSSIAHWDVRSRSHGMGETLWVDVSYGYTTHKDGLYGLGISIAIFSLPAVKGWEFLV